MNAAEAWERRGERRREEKERNEKKGECHFSFSLCENNSIRTNYISASLRRRSTRDRSGYCDLLLSMQQVQGQNPNGSRLSTSSHSSVSAATNAYLNGLLSPQRSSQTSPSAATSGSNLTASQLQALRKETNRLKRSTTIQHVLIIVLLTIVLALLLIGNIELATKFVRNQREEHLSAWHRNLSSSLSSTLTNSNRTKVTGDEKAPRFRSYFACIWLFNGLLFVPCLIAHSVSIQRRSRRGRTLAVLLR